MILAPLSGRFFLPKPSLQGVIHLTYFRHMDISSKVKAWLYAFRLRTLPLAFSSIITGSFIAWNKGFNWSVLGLAILTTLLLQVLSNLANDYGDSEKGADNDNRIGPKRAIQSGMLSFAEIKRAIYIFTFLCLISGSALIKIALPGREIEAVIFLMLGFGAIAAAIKYTVGKGAYGYYGMGDLFVMLFFGIVGVCGSYYLQAHQFSAALLLPGICIGCFATGVLNLNNIRDQVSDRQAGKITLVVRMGARAAKYYHTALITLGWFSMLIFSFLQPFSSVAFSYILSAPLFWRNVMAVWRVEDPKELDPYLKQLAISTFLFSLFFAVGWVIS